MDKKGDASSAQFFDALNHPIRVKILSILERQPETFSELKKEVGTESSGHLAFHLEKLGSLIRVNGEGKYELSADGREAAWLAASLRRVDNSHALPEAHRLIELRRAYPKLVLALGLVNIVALASLLVVLYYPGLARNPGTGISPGTAESCTQVFGSSFQSENVTFAALPVGGSVSFDGAMFTRLPYTGLPGYPAGFNLTWTTSSGSGGGGAVPSQEGNYACSQNPSSGAAAGYFVYPSQGLFKLVVKD